MKVCQQAGVERGKMAFNADEGIWESCNETSYQPNLAGVARSLDVTRLMGASTHGFWLRSRKLDLVDVIPQFEMQAPVHVTIIWIRVGLFPLSYEPVT
jgi:hypothetical protein